MRSITLAACLAVFVPSMVQAQPLEQNFAFGAPLGVLGNDRFRALRQPDARTIAPRSRSGRVAVRFHRAGLAGRHSAGGHEHPYR